MPTFSAIDNAGCVVLSHFKCTFLCARLLSIGRFGLSLSQWLVGETGEETAFSN